MRPKTDVPTMAVRTETQINKTECFVIMPIADPDGYQAGHFKHVYNNIIIPACENVDVKPIRADDVQSTNLIHLDILKKLIETPIAICDLSSRNPNVLFELGIRQAFDKPVILLQETGTPKIFDISPLRYLEYSKEMKYHDVLDTQKSLGEYIKSALSTSNDTGTVNSIIKLLALSAPAKIPEISGDRTDIEFNIIRQEMQQIRRAIEMIRYTPPELRINTNQNSRAKNLLTMLAETERMDTIQHDDRINMLDSIIFDAKKQMERTVLKSEQSELFSIIRKASQLRDTIQKDKDDIPF